MKDWHHCCVHWKLLILQTFHHWYLLRIWQHWWQHTQKDSPLLWSHLMTKLQLYPIQSSISGWYRRGEFNSEDTHDSKNMLVFPRWAIKVQAGVWRTLVCYMHYVLVLYFEVKYVGTCQASWYWLIFHTSVMLVVVSCLGYVKHCT